MNHESRNVYPIGKSNRRKAMRKHLSETPSLSMFFPISVMLRTTVNASFNDSVFFTMVYLANALKRSQCGKCATSVKTVASGCSCHFHERKTHFSPTDVD